MKLPTPEMLAKPVVWFAAACGMLTLALGAEWMPGGPPSENFTPPAHRHVTVALAASGADADSSGDRDVDSWDETILARPLFAVGRRPAKHQEGRGSIAATGMPRLSGIIVTRASRRAIFMPDGGKPLVLAEGASLDDATIRRITADRVYLTGPKGDQVLVPSFDSNRVPPPPIIPVAQPFQPINPNGFRPIFPNMVQPPVQPPTNNANDDDDDNNDDSSQPAAPPRPVVPVPPLPGGFRNPMFPRGRPE